MQISTNSPTLKNTIREASTAVKHSVELLPNLSEDQKRDVLRAIDKTDVTTAVTAEVPNTFVYWIAVGAVAAVCTIIVMGGLYLAASGMETPNYLQMALATAIGALAGMAVPTPKAGV